MTSPKKTQRISDQHKRTKLHSHKHVQTHLVGSRSTCVYNNLLVSAFVCRARRSSAFTVIWLQERVSIASVRSKSTADVLKLVAYWKKTHEPLFLRPLSIPFGFARMCNEQRVTFSNEPIAKHLFCFLAVVTFSKFVSLWFCHKEKIYWSTTKVGRRDGHQSACFWSSTLAPTILNHRRFFGLAFWSSLRCLVRNRRKSKSAECEGEETSSHKLSRLSFSDTRISCCEQNKVTLDGSQPTLFQAGQQPTPWTARMNLQSQRPWAAAPSRKLPIFKRKQKHATHRNLKQIIFFRN